MIEVSGSTILALIGSIFAGACILIGVIWSQLTHRIKSGEVNHGELKKDADKEREKQTEASQRIYDKLEANQQMSTQGLGEVTRAMGDLRESIAQNMVTKADCADARAAMRVKAR